MYIRIQQQCIRYRISQSEANELIEGKVLREQVQLSTKDSLAFSISASNEPSVFNYLSQKNSLTLTINKKALINEIKSRPSKKGIAITSTEKSGDLQVTLEIDMKKR